MDKVNIGFDRKLKLKIYFRIIFIVFLLAGFGTLYIVWGMNFSGKYMWNLAGSVALLTVLALLSNYIFYDVHARSINKYQKTGKNVLKAYAQSLNFPYMYALSCSTSYALVVFGVMIYMSIFTQVNLIGVVDIFIGGFIAVIPGGMLIYFALNEMLLPIVNKLFYHSKIKSIVEQKNIRKISIKNKILFTFIVISTNAFVALGAFFIYTLFKMDVSHNELIRSIVDVLVISVFNLSVAIAAGIMISRHINNSLQIIETNLNNIVNASGDLTKRAEIVSNDEFGRIGGWLNLFMANMATLVSDIRSTSNRVSEIAESLSATTEEINASTEEVTATINVIATGANNQMSRINNVVNLSENIEGDAVNVLDTTKRAEKIVEDVVKTALEGRKGSEQAVEEVSELAEQTDRAVSAIRNLTEKVEQIGTIAEAIRNISGQTNLLALNAAIESARAGEYGTGFGVIAQEIRNLNEDTQRAAENIAEIIMLIQQSTEAVIGKIENVSLGVDKEKKTIEYSSHILQQIAFGISDAEKAVKEISHLAESQRDSLKKVVTFLEETASIAESNAGATQEVSASSEEQVNSVEDMANSAQELSMFALKLREYMDKFKL